MLSAAFSRCSSASRSSARPMPALSFSSPSCSVTIPISANATIPIHSAAADQPVEQAVLRDGASSAEIARARNPAPPAPRAGARARRAGAGTATGARRAGDAPRAARRRRRGVRAGANGAAAVAAAGGVIAAPRCSVQLAGGAQARRGRARVARDLLGRGRRSSGA